jgi:hypothetical protein
MNADNEVGRNGKRTYPYSDGRVNVYSMIERLRCQVLSELWGGFNVERKE